MYYLANFKWQQVSTPYFDALNNDTDLRNRITKKNPKNTFIRPKTSRGRAKKILMKQPFERSKDLDKVSRSGELIESLIKNAEGYTDLKRAVEIESKEPFRGLIGNKKYAKSREFNQELNKKLANLPLSEKNKILGLVQDGKVAEPKTKVVERIIEKVVNPQVSASSTQVPEKIVSTVTTPKVASKTSSKLGRNLLYGLGGTALLGAGLYGINKMRKSRSDKGRKRGRYN